MGMTTADTPLVHPDEDAVVRACGYKPKVDRPHLAQRLRLAVRRAKTFFGLQMRGLLYR